MLDTFVHQLLRTENRGVRMHGFLHIKTDLRGWQRALGVAEFIQTRERHFLAVSRDFLVLLSFLHRRGAPQAGRTSEHHQIEQGVGTQTVATTRSEENTSELQSQKRN